MMIYVLNTTIILLPPCNADMTSSLLSVADSLQKNVLLSGTIEPRWSNIQVAFYLRTLSLYRTLITSLPMLKKKTRKEFFP